jgi:heme/copper-type cytochrome/quinol oxidase subunit 2
VKEELTKFITEVPIKAHGAVGTGMAATTGAHLTDWINLFNTWVTTAAFIVGLVVTVLSAISLFYKIRQEKVKAERDQLELEMYRKQLEDMAQKG